MIHFARMKKLFATTVLTNGGRVYLQYTR